MSLDTSMPLNMAFVHRSPMVPEGQMFAATDFGRYSGVHYFVGPITYWRLNHGGRSPMLSRYAPGMIALDRHRRQKS